MEAFARSPASQFTVGLRLGVELEETVGDGKLVLRFLNYIIPGEPGGGGRGHHNAGNLVFICKVDDILCTMEIDLHVHVAVVEGAHKRSYVVNGVDVLALDCRGEGTWRSEVTLDTSVFGR